MQNPTTTPFDFLKQQNRMIVHLKHHRENLCGVEMLSDACLKYVSELYPVGDPHAGDSTRTAVALFAFLTGKVDLHQYIPTPIHGAPCPVPDPTKPQALYLNLTESTTNRFCTAQGCSMVILFCKQRVRILHTLNVNWTLHEHVRSTGSMSRAAFESWWQTLQSLLELPPTPVYTSSPCTKRPELYQKLFNCSFTISSWNPLAGSWMYLADVDLGFAS